MVKDGFEVLAAILPVKVLSKKYIEKLRMFYVQCIEQYKWEQCGQEQENEEQ